MAGLTPMEVKNAKAGRHADGKGLYLLVKPSGAKSWVLRVQVGGRRRDYGLGSLDLVSLYGSARPGAGIPQGRKVRPRSLPGAQEGATGDPDLRGSRSPLSRDGEGELAKRETCGPMAEHPQGPCLPDARLASSGPYRCPDHPVGAAADLADPPETARRVRQRIASVLDFAHGQGWRVTETPRNAINTLMKRIKQPRRSGGFAAMPYAELPAFMGKLKSETPTVGRLALQFLILTAARSGEVRGARWEEIDFEKAQWNIPADRMKAGEAHSVPLRPDAVETLRQVRELTTVRKGQPIFPGLKGQPLSDATLAKVLRVAVETPLPSTACVRPSATGSRSRPFSRRLGRGGARSYPSEQGRGCLQAHQVPRAAAETDGSLGGLPRNDLERRLSRGGLTEPGAFHICSQASVYVVAGSLPQTAPPVGRREYCDVHHLSTGPGYASAPCAEGVVQAVAPVGNVRRCDQRLFPSGDDPRKTKAGSFLSGCATRGSRD